MSLPEECFLSLSPCPPAGETVQIWRGQSWGRERGLCELSRDRKQTWGLSFASSAHCVGALPGWGRLPRFFSAPSVQPDPRVSLSVHVWL